MIKIKQYKVELISIIIGLAVIGAFYGTIKTIYANSAEAKIYSMNGMSGEVGSQLEGLSLSIEKDKIDCNGFFVFNCKISDVKIDIKSMNQTAFEIDSVTVYGLTKNGFKDGLKAHPKFVAKGIRLSDELDISKDISTEGQVLKDLLTPFDVTLDMETVRNLRTPDSNTKVFIKYESNVAKIEISGNLHTEVKKGIAFVDKNLSITRNELDAVAERNNNSNVATIVDRVELSLYDKESISELLYSLYSFYITAYKTDKEKEYFNITTIGYTSSEKVTEDKFISEISDRLQSLIPHYDDKYTTQYLTVIDNILNKKIRSIHLTGKNKNKLTLFELNTLIELDTFKGNESKYFDLNITSKER